VLRLGDGTHLHLKTTKEKKEKGEPKLPLSRNLAMAPTCAQKEKKNQKKEKEGELKVPLLLRLGHGAPKATKKIKKGGASSLFAESWQWRLKNNKTKQNKRGSKLPFC